MDTYLIKKKKINLQVKVITKFFNCCILTNLHGKTVVFLRESHPEHCSNESSFCEAQDT